jgi:Na+/H+-dicarboxylate symporter
MGRSAVNVIGNSIAATAVATWEGELIASRGPGQQPAHARASSVRPETIEVRDADPPRD